MRSASASAYTKPEHTACTSNAGPPAAPIFACRMLAVDGKMMSGVVVATTIRSTSAGASVAAASALRAAASAKSDVCSPSAATWRLRMTVRERIHSSLVATRSASASLVTMRSGRYEPVPAMRLCMGAQRARRVVRGPHGRHFGDSLGDLLQHAVLDLGGSSLQRVGEGEGVGTAVALDDDTLEPDERCPVVAARIDPALERHQHRIDDRRGDAR